KLSHPVVRFLHPVLKLPLPVRSYSAVYPRHSSHECCIPFRPSGWRAVSWLPFLDLPFSGRYRASKMAASSAQPQFVTAPADALRFAHGAPEMPSGYGQPDQPTLLAYFDTLLAAYGNQHWWPGRTRFEIIVGAILAQNTSWRNVERALANLRRAK